MFTKTGYQKKIAVLEEVNAALEKRCSDLTDALRGALSISLLWLPAEESVSQEHFGEAQALGMMHRKFQALVAEDLTKPTPELINTVPASYGQYLRDLIARVDIEFPAQRKMLEKDQI